MMIQTDWKYSLPFLNAAYQRLAQHSDQNSALLQKLDKRIQLLKTIHKCSDEVAALLENEEFRSVWDEMSPRLLQQFFKEIFAAEEAVKISVNVMTYNEERCIERCLASVRALADEIIVLDTGSTDRTVEIVQHHFPEAKIFQTKWQEDFSQARNLMVQYSTHDWIVQIDADEYLVDPPLDLKALIQMFQHCPIQPLVISPTIVNHDHSEFQHSKRIFNKRSGLTYFGLIHEELRYDIEKRGTDLYHVMTELKLFHDGYTPEVVQEKDKFSRNKALLERMIQVEPTNIRWYYFLAREKFYLDEPLDEIIQLVNEGIRHKDVSPDLDHFHLACLILLATIYDRMGDAVQLKKVVEEIKTHYPYCIDALYYELSTTFERNTQELYVQSEQVLQNLLTIDDPLSFIHSQGFHLYKLLGLIFFYRGDYKLAFKLFSKISDPEELSEIIEQMSLLRDEIDQFLATVKNHSPATL